MEIVSDNEVEVRLGVEPEDVSLVKKGLRVEVIPVNRPRVPSVTGRVRAVSQSINPATRLVDVFVTMDSKSALMLNEYVKAKIVVESRQALIVPRSAVLPSGDKYVIFLVKDGKARLNTVHVGTENGNEVEIWGDGISVGDQVVTVGNYELTDGMAVRIGDKR